MGLLTKHDKEIKEMIDTCDEQIAMLNEEFDIAKEPEKEVYSQSIYRTYYTDEPYLTEIPKAEPITLLQFQKLLFQGVYVWIKRSNHRTYYSGDAMYIPKFMYDWKVRDMSLIKPNDIETHPHGSIVLFVDEYDETCEEYADRVELNDINAYYSRTKIEDER